MCLICGSRSVPAGRDGRGSGQTASLPERLARRLTSAWSSRFHTVAPYAGQRRARRAEGRTQGVGAGTLWSVSAYRPSNLVAVVLSDGLYAITGGQRLSSPPRFAEVARSLGAIAGLRVSSDDDLRRALVQLQRPSLIEVEVAERAWPGPSPFVDPAKVRLAFAANVGRGQEPAGRR